MVTISHDDRESVATCYHGNPLCLGYLNFLWLSAVIDLVSKLSKLVVSKSVAVTLNCNIQI